MNSILETNKDFDILFIQKPSWSFVCTIPSSSNEDEDRIVGVPNHPDWIIFSRPLIDNNNYSQVISYIITYLSYMQFSLRKNIFNHKDICYFSFFNNSDIFFMINVYSDDHQSTLKYLKGTEVNLHNVLIMAENFNIRDSNWDPSYSFHLIHSNFLFEVANSFNLKLSSPIQQVPTCYFDNENNANLVIDLFLLWLNSIEVNNHIVFPELWYPSNHTLLTANISISEEFI